PEVALRAIARAAVDAGAKALSLLDYAFLNWGARATDQGVPARGSARPCHGAVLARRVRRDRARPAGTPHRCQPLRTVHHVRPQARSLPRQPRALLAGGPGSVAGAARERAGIRTRDPRVLRSGAGADSPPRRSPGLPRVQCGVRAG